MGHLEDKEIFFMGSDWMRGVLGQLYSAASDTTLDRCHPPLANGISYGFVDRGKHGSYSWVELLRERVP